MQHYGRLKDSSWQAHLADVRREIAGFEKRLPALEAAEAEHVQQLEALRRYYVPE